MEALLLITTRTGVGATGMWRGEARDVALQPTWHRTIPSTKNYLTQNVHGAETLAWSKQHPGHVGDQ